MRKASSYCEMRVDRLGIADRLGLPGVELVQRVERLPPARAIHAPGVREEEDGIARRSALDTLIDRGQEAAAPDALARVGRLAAAGEHHEPGQVLVLGAQSVGRPGAQRRAAELGGARVQEELGGGVVELVGLHRLDHGEVVDHPRQVLPDLAQLRAGLAVAGELERRAQHVGHARDEGEPLPLEQLVGAGLAVVLAERGLVVEEVELAGRARHVQVDDVLDPRGQGRRPAARAGCPGLDRDGALRSPPRVSSFSRLARAIAPSPSPPRPGRRSGGD